MCYEPQIYDEEFYYEEDDVYPFPPSKAQPNFYDEDEEELPF